ncbi:hypothetical protein [Gynuella sp.]|uniref:hypothetical protein n=1 Tax=Gynuella sp. TaxID=2969146 RepID=UPI003D14EECA
MENTHKVKTSDKWFGRLLVLFGIIVFPSVMIYLEVNNVDTENMFITGLGLVTIAALFIAVFAFIAAIFIKLIRLLFGK